jgi:glutathione peroxidase
MRLLTALALLSLTVMAHAEPALYSIPLKTIDDRPATLQAYAGKVLLIVNVASQCGFTPQYEGLQSLYQKYQARGLEVLGFPSNDFGQQEPGTEAEIKEFCSSRYHVTFPMFSKIHIAGSEPHPLYAALTGKDSPKAGPVQWNFGKFLIGRDGRILARYDSDTEPDSAELTKAVESALAASK